MMDHASSASSSPSLVATEMSARLRKVESGVGVNNQGGSGKQSPLRADQFNRTIVNNMFEPDNFKPDNDPIGPIQRFVWFLSFFKFLLVPAPPAAACRKSLRIARRATSASSWSPCQPKCRLSRPKLATSTRPWCVWSINRVSFRRVITIATCNWPIWWRLPSRMISAWVQLMRSWTLSFPN